MRASLRDGLPVRLEHDGRVRTVARVLDAWRVGNRWWRGEAPSDHWLLEFEDGTVAEVCEQAGAWRWLRVVD